jgi:hypothetical protein
VAGDWTVIGTFGGGLDFSKNPAALDDSQWSWCQNMRVDGNAACTHPRYYQMIPPVASYPAALAGQTIIGLLPNPFSGGAGHLILVTRATAGSSPYTVKFWTCSLTITGATLITEIPWDGVGAPVTWYDTVQSKPQIAFLDGYMVVTVGGGVAGYSMMRWNGGASAYATILVATTFRCAHLESFAGHLIAANVGVSEGLQRTIRMSDANSTTVWTPDISNSADEGVLDDSFSGITGLALLSANALGVFTRPAAYALAPTGNIPPFTRVWVGGRGVIDRGGPLTWATVTPWLGNTPYGPAVVSYDNVYLPLDQPIGTPVYRALQGGEFETGNDGKCPRLMWHPGWAHLYVPMLVYGSAGQRFFSYNPGAQAWAQHNVPGIGGALDHVVVLDSTIGEPTGGFYRYKHLILTTDGAVYLEREAFDPADTVTSFVDSKDYALPIGRYVDRVRVEWEALSTTPVPQLTVQVCSREQLDPRAEDSLVVPSRTFAFDLTRVFNEMPADHRFTLAAGEAEGPVHARGKWIRFRFSAQGAAFRIRSWGFRTVQASDRATAPDPTSGPGVVTTVPGPAQWDRDDLDIGDWS